MLQKKQKKEMKMMKTHFLTENNKKCEESICKNIKYSLLRTCPTDLWCNCSKLYRYRENIGDKKLSVEHTLQVQPEGYLEPHNDVGSQSPFRPSSSVGFELRTFQFCMLCAIPMCQPPHIKNKKNKKNNIWKIRMLLWFTQLEPING